MSAAKLKPRLAPEDRIRFRRETGPARFMQDQRRPVLYWHQDLLDLQSRSEFLHMFRADWRVGRVNRG